MTTQDIANLISTDQIFKMTNVVAESEAVLNNTKVFTSKFKALSGSEKQIAWAEKIRAEKANEFGYKVTMNRANALGLSQGLKNILALDYNALLQKLAKEYSVFQGSCAASIINAR